MHPPTMVPTIKQDKKKTVPTKINDKRIQTTVEQTDVEEELNADTLKPSCKATVDIGFVIDRSLNTDQGTQNHFLKTLAFTLGITNYVSHPSIIVFGDDAELSLKFSKHNNLYMFYDKLEELPAMGNNSRLDKGLRLVQEQMFKTENGAREDVPRVLVLVTSGPQSDVKEANKSATLIEEITDSGVKVILLNTGMKQYKDGLKTINADRISPYSAESPEELLSTKYIKSLTSAVCTLGK